LISVPSTPFLMVYYLVGNWGVGYLEYFGPPPKEPAPAAKNSMQPAMTMSKDLLSFIVNNLS
jgi:hypothetical protein